MEGSIVAEGAEASSAVEEELRVGMGSEIGWIGRTYYSSERGDLDVSTEVGVDSGGQSEEGLFKQ